MLDILDEYKVNPKILEHLQKQARDLNDVDLNCFYPKLETKGRSMNKEKGFYVQHRREYYNDFEDCIREYKNAKIKSLQKQTKVHLSDGDNGDSDSEYVDCTDSNELKHQSTHKSMPHVPSGNYQENFCQQLDLKPTTKRKEAAPPTQTQTATATSLNTNYDALRIEHETPTQLTSHNNNHNQIIDSSCNNTLAISSDNKVSSSEKSIAVIHVPSTSIDDVNQIAADKQSKPNEPAKLSPVQIVVKKDEQAKRKSCKKKQENPTQR